MQNTLYKVLFIVSVFSSTAFAQKAILADKILLDQAAIQTLKADDLTGLAYAVIDESEEQRLLAYAHALGKCGGFEMLSQNHSLSKAELNEVFNSVHLMNTRMMQIASLNHVPQIIKKSNIELAVGNVSKERIKKHVEWLSSFKNRYHRSPNANVAINAVVEYLEKSLPSEYQVSLVDHDSTSQKSIKVRLEGSTYPNEVVVLGGHIDSTINSFFESDPHAPGADDNASGSADIMETLFVFSELQYKPSRTIEFFFYAGEEGGLLGSAEIAESYKNNKIDVVSVMQLDMTSFAGSGEFVFSNMTDFTDPSLRALIEELNTHYIGGKVIYSKCGYGCSDHASWYRRGFSTVMPFESHFNTYNKKIHTKNDLISHETNFDHAAMFAKLSVAYLMELADSRWRSGESLLH